MKKRKIGKPYVTAADWRETMEVKRTIKTDVESFETGSPQIIECFLHIFCTSLTLPSRGEGFFFIAFFRFA